jgi:hypothetical protein
MIKNKITPYILCVVLLSCFSFFVQAKSKYELGVFTGTSWYWGDINQTKLFYSPSPSGGFLYKYTLNPRENIRAHLNYAQFRGADRDFTNSYQLQRNASFNSILLDMGVCYELSYLKFKFNPRHRVLSPYLFGGLGWEHPITGNVKSHFVIPFGTGVKYFYSNFINVGMEWSFRKTFQDQIDNVSNVGPDVYKSQLSNKDWYSFVGFFITFRLFDRNEECSAYK